MTAITVDAAIEPTVGPARRALRVAGSIISTTASVVAVMVATLTVFVAVATHMSDSGEYTVFGHPVLIVVSGSMSPAIDTGDLIWDDAINATDARHLERNQIITFRSSPNSPKTFTHRIVDITTQDGELAYVTKGDANNAADTTLVQPSQVIGTYHGRIPYGGYLLHALHKPMALILLIASPLLWLLASWFFHLARDIENGEQDPALAGEAEVAAP
jgi:signal peptidase